MFKKFLGSLLLAASAGFIALPALAATEPTMHEVYTAAQEGRYIEAQSMMDQVLKAHPDSAKAHYVQAELFARQGLRAKATDALADAERLQPGLAFVKPESVEKLRASIAASPRLAAPSPGRNMAAPAAAAAPQDDMRWKLLLAGAGLVGFLVIATRFMRRRNAATAVPAGSYAYGTNTGMQPQPSYGMAPYGAQPMGPVAGSGIGSGIMGGLATGAAVGAGLVAGQALMRHFTDGDNAGHSGGATPTPAIDNSWAAAPNDDIGGNDFGIADSGSWDDGSAGSSSDWN